MTAFDAVTLDRLRVQFVELLSREVGATLADSVNVVIDPEPHPLLGSLAFRVTGELLAETLPPQTITEFVAGETHAWVPDGLWAELVRRHGHRWWLRWYKGQPRERKVTVPWQRAVQVEVRSRWTYPRAAIALPPVMGAPVLQVGTMASSRPWTMADCLASWPSPESGR